MKPNFCIITTTYKRPEAVLKSVASVIAQTLSTWEMIVVIDDITSDYGSLKKSSDNSNHITYLQNEKNLGKNASVNRALTQLQTKNFAGYIIFLDDDDWLSLTCLEDFAQAIEQSPTQNWFVSQRAHARTAEPFTKNTTGRSLINYKYDYLLRRTFTGDATHCISFTQTKNIQFPTTIKNAEEWLYFAEVSVINPTFVYIPKIGTYSEEYEIDGLTSNYHKLTEKQKNNRSVINEICRRKLFSPYILFYICARLIRSIY